MKVKLLLLLFLFWLVSTALALPPNVTGGNAYCQPDGTWIGSASDAGAALPRHCINTALSNTPSPGNHTVVPASSDINLYLAQAQCGDVLLLTPGQYKPFTLPAKNCDAGHWIRIQSGAASGLPVGGVRISPCSAGLVSLPGRPAYTCLVPQQSMAKISALPSFDITAASGANYYRIGPGIELTRPDTAGHSKGLVVLAGSDHIIFDRVWVHGTELAAETKNGISFTGATNVAVINSYLNNFKCIAGTGGSCTDAHAFGGGDDPAGLPEGIWKIYDNYIEASGENILFGGALNGTTTPSDIEIRLNHLYKVPAWNLKDPGYVQPYPGFKGYIVKNLFELKNAQRALIEGNRMEYSWGGYSQDGAAILLTPRGAWAHTNDITIRYNYLSHVGTGFELTAERSCTASTINPLECKNGSGFVKDSGGSARMSLHDNLVDDVNAVYFLGHGSMAEIASRFQYNLPLNNVVLDHNTFITDGVEGSILTFGAVPTNPQPHMGPFTFTNNIVRAGKYNGIWSTGKPSICAVDMYPIPTFSNCFSQSNVSGNLIVGWASVRPAGPWPTSNQTPASYTTIFVNPLLSGGNYHVLAPYQNAGTDGKDIGADIDSIAQFMQRAEQ
jgi:hypothetical protein